MRVWTYLEALSDAAKTIPYGYSNSRHKSIKVSKLLSSLPPFGGGRGGSSFLTYCPAVALFWHPWGRLRT